ncbi:MAG TPA: choice-of-anchor D domain-containing protein [Candidatus Eisenbacteria bacterium]|nr:choice-of-anchor D domain-containing protein [Candidatus Eisenbacteria bacterium]
MRGPSLESFALRSIALFLAFAVSIAWAAPADATPPAKEGELIIKFRSGTPQSIIDAIRSDIGASRVRAFGRIRAEQDLISAGTVQGAIDRYRGHPAVEIIEPNYILSEAVTPNDPLFPQLWGLNNTGQTGGLPGADISATDAWNISTGSSAVVVAIIDTGIDYSHPDLAPNIFLNAGEIPANGIDDDGNGYIDDVRGWDFVNHDNDPYDDRGHGTHVAGTIGAVGNNGLGVAGVAWQVKLMPLKFLSSGGTGTTADAIAAIEYATSMGVDIMSNSWGGGAYSLALQEAIADAGNAGILFVAAAGNASNNNDFEPFYPAGYDLPNVISVAASDATDHIASFSNYGATTVDLAAPGVDILSTIPGSGYGLNSGTSMAAPHVSGVLAVMKARFPSAPLTSLKARLLASVDPLPALSGLVATGGRVNAFAAMAEPDSVPPSAPTGLVVAEAASNSLRVRWTAPGDDGDVGRPSLYEVRYATSPFTEATFPTASLAAGAPDPQPAGSTEEMEIGGLDFTTTYYVAVRALDEMGNASPISNVVSESTLGAPAIALDPASIAQALLTGASANPTLNVRNDGEGTLDFTIATNLVGGASVLQEYLPLARGEDDPRVGEPVLTSVGGPDAFGYRWMDSDQPGGPVFDWVEISAIGTQLPMSGLDENYGPIPIGFTFPFYGGAFSSLRACTHGWLSFTNTSVAYSNQPLPNPGAPENLLAIFWDDLNFSGLRRAYYHNDGSRFILEYRDVPRTGGGGPFTFQVLLYPDGRIVYQYLTMSEPTNSGTIGIQNAARNDGLNVAFNTAYVHAGLAIEFRQIPAWLHVSPLEGRVLAGQSAPLNLAIDATDLGGGAYHAEVRIGSNDPATPVAIVPVDLTVTGVADIDLSRTSFDFGQVFVGGSRTDTLVIANRGTNPLSVTEIAATSPDFGASPGSFTVPIGSRRTVLVTFHPGSAAPLAGALLIRSDDPDEPELSVAVQGVGVVAPDIAVSPPSLSADLLTGQIADRALTVANEGGSDLEFHASVTNVVFPDLAPSATPPSRSVDEVLSGYASFLAAPPSAAPPSVAGPQPGVLPLWERVGPGILDGTVIFHDDMESGANGWTHAATNGGLDMWGQSTARAHGGSTSWRVAQHESQGADALRSPLIDLRLQHDATLTFWHWYRFDDCGDPGFDPDGGIVEVSPDGGATWTQVAPLTGYPYVLDDYCGNPLASKAAYAHSGGVGSDFVPAVFDLSAFVGEQILVRFRAGWDCGNCALNEGWYIDDVTVSSSFPPVLLVAPADGTVAPGSSSVLNARFDAAGLMGGDYGIDLTIASNDPDESSVIVPAVLHVTGAPDIAWSPGAFDFGSVFVGLARTDTLLVVNAGTDALHVSGLSIDHAAFSVATAAFDLAPGAVRVLPVTFAPGAAASFMATLSVSSDDADESIVTVPLQGTGLIAPDVAVDPSSLSADLLTGQTGERTLTVANTGGSDLVLAIGAEWPSAALGTGFTPSGREPGTASSAEARDDTAVPTAAPAADTKPAVLVIQESSAWGLNMAAFIQSFFGITPTVIASGQIAATDFSKFALIVTVGDESSAYYAALTANVSKFAAFVSAGGVVQYQLATQGSNVSIAGGARVLYGGGELQNRVLLPSHPIVAGLPSVLHGNSANHCSVTDLPAGARIITETYDTHLPTTVEYRVGKGTVVATGMTWEYLYLNGYDAGPMLYQATDYSLSRGRPTWISFDPTSATVPAGGALSVRVGFDAAGLIGGRYDALLTIESNDPDEAVLGVPATMNVTGVPIVSLSPSSLDFDSLFVGETASRSLRVANIGTDVLTVSDVASDEASYAASPGAFSVAVGDTEVVSVLFSPTSAGSKPATLSLAHNAAGSPAAVPLRGVALVPPDIATDPSSLAADLRTGEISHQALTVQNFGGSDLKYAVEIRPGDTDPAAGSPVEVPAELRLPKPNETSPGGPPPTAQAVYEGTQLRFGVTEYGEIMPFQFPIGREHLDLGSPKSGYTVAYVRDGIDRLAYAAQDARTNLTAVSYREVENSAARVVVEVVTRTFDGGLLIRRLITFPRARSYIRVETTLEAAAGASLSNIVFKEFADWDADSTFFNNWDYDRPHNMTYAWMQNYVAIASGQAPTFMDLEGWSDWYQRATNVDFPAGPVAGYDGLAILHFALGDLGPAQSERVVTAYGAASSLSGLRGEMGAAVGLVDWLAVSPSSGSVPAGGSVQLDVTFDPGRHVTGDYRARIVQVSNDPDEPEFAVPVAMHVTGAPVIEVSPTALEFDSLFVGAGATRLLTVTNAGTETLNVFEITLSDDSYGVNAGAFVLAPGASWPVTVSFDPQTAGPKPGTLTIAHNAAGSPTIVNLTGVALEPPVLTLSPTSIHRDQETGTIGHATLSVGNVGGSDLRFAASARVGAAAVALDSIPPPDKWAPDTRTGDVVTLGSGGPDLYGYRWIDSDQTGGPVYQWVDIRATGTSIPITGDDMTSPPVPIGFNFGFYGQSFNAVRVCTNGWLSFTSSSATYSNTPLPSTFAPPNLLAAFWDDLLFTAASRAYYRNDGTRFIVQFDTVYNLGLGGPYTFEVILYPTGAVLFQYASMIGQVSSATVGIQNQSLSDGLTTAFNQPYVHDGLAVRFAAGPSWLSLNPLGGSVPAGGTLPIDLEFNSSGLFIGDYAATLDVESNDPAAPHRTVPVSLHVIGIPDLAVAPASLDFDTLYTGQSAVRSLLVTNLGTDRLDVTSISAGLPDFTVSPSALSLQPLQSATVSVTYTVGALGVRSGTLALHSNDPDSPTFVPLVAVALVPPAIAIAPGDLEIAAMPGGQATRVLTVSNTGGSDLRFQVQTADATRVPVALGSYLSLGKEETDPRAGLLGAGGPDAFGHFWIDSDDPGGPTFQWHDISAIGTKVAFSSYDDDRTLGPFPIGFSFPFYGSDFHQFRVCTNGWISFTSSSSSYENQPLPNAGPGVPENMLAPFWDDLIHRTDVGSSVYYHFDGTQLIVQYNNMLTFGPILPSLPTFQIILRPNGEVVYQYLKVGDRSTGVTVGMQDGSRGDGLGVSFNASYPRDNMAIEFSTPPPWVSVSPPSGVVPAGGSMPVTVSIDASELEEGNYTATFLTVSNDPAHPDVGTPLLLHVALVGAAASDFDPNTLNLDSNGRFTNAYVELPPGLDPRRVVLSSVRFRDVLGVTQDDLMIGDFNGNGVPDLHFRMDRQQVEALLPEGPTVPIWLTGEVENTTYFKADGIVRVIRPVVTSPNGGELLLTGVPYLLSWRNPIGWSPDYAALYYSTDRGDSWTAIADHVVGESYSWSVPNVVSPSAKLRVYLFDRDGVMGYDSSDETFGMVNSITSVEETSSSLPATHALYQNSPNPFNPSTVIRFDLPEAGAVSLEVFQVDGRKVRTLVHAPRPAGRHQVIWDGRDERGREVGSGVYLYRVKAGAYEASKRMILVK